MSSDSRFVTRRARRVFAALLGALATLPATAGAALPDLVSEAPSRPYLEVYDGDGSEPQRLLLRFDAFIHNKAGAGDLELIGDATSNSGSSVPRQVVAGEAVPRALKPEARFVYEAGAGGRLEDGHDHFHFARAAEYSLRSADGAAEVGLAAKIGFCMLDSGYLGDGPPPNPARFVPPMVLCRHNAAADQVRMGISPGWIDVYGANTMFQWVDVSETSPGPYKVRAVVDPDDLIVEEHEDNGYGDTDAVLPGYAAKERIVQREAGGSALAVGLGYDAFHSQLPQMTKDGQRVQAPLAAPQYTLVDAPSHGTVDLPKTWVSDPAVLYTPDAGSTAADSFTYAVREAGSGFPRKPFVATVAITVDGEKPQPVIAIGAAPQQMIAGSSVELSSTPAAESWTASAGFITDEGRFTAPTTIPAGGDVTITAVSAEGAIDRRTIRIIPKPKPEPAPAPPEQTRGEPLVHTEPNPFVPPTPVAVLPRTAALGRVSAVRVGRFVAVSVNAGQPGRLTISLRRGAKKIRGCVIDVRAGAAHTCRIRRPRGERSALKVVVAMRKLAGGTVTRTVALKAPPRARASAHRH